MPGIHSLSSTAAIERQTEIQQSLQASLWALVRAEIDGRVPARFTGTGQEVWKTFRNELTAVDLLFAQYLRTTPLVWEAIREVTLPHAEASARPLAGDGDAEAAQDETELADLTAGDQIEFRKSPGRAAIAGPVGKASEG